MYAEEAVIVLSHLLYNQDQVSPRMWSFYLVIIDGIINNRDFMDGILNLSIVPIFNFINKDPNTLRQGTYDGNSTYLDLCFNLISQIFKIGSESEDELVSMIAVSVTNHLLDSVQGIDSSLQTIL